MEENWGYIYFTPVLVHLKNILFLHGCARKPLGKHGATILESRIFGFYIYMVEITVCENSVHSRECYAMSQCSAARRRLWRSSRLRGLSGSRLHG